MATIPAPIDLSNLRQMTGDDTAFLIEVLELIRNQSPIVLLQMKDDLKKDDLDSVGSSAHKFKSTLHVLGNPQWLNVLKTIEVAAREEHDREAASELLDDFGHVCDDIMDSIANQLDLLRNEAA